MEKRISVLVVCLSLLQTVGLSMPSSAAGRYKFSTDWVNTEGRAEDWPGLLEKFKGRKNVHGLEIGSFEGRSAIWFLDNILTARSSTLTCVDIFPSEYEVVFDDNLRESGHGKRVIKMKGFSDQVLRTLKPNSYDFIYIDGCHKAHCVYLDAALSWDLLKVGGIMMFDDWLWSMNQPITERPKVSIDAFVEAFAPFIRVIEYQNSHSFYLEKLSNTRKASKDLWYISRFYRGSERFVKTVLPKIATGKKVHPHTLNHWFAGVDDDHDGVITKDEYLANADASHFVPAFGKLTSPSVDTNGDDGLGAAEAMKAYGARLPVVTLQRWMKGKTTDKTGRIDSNRDGLVTREEYLRSPGGGGEFVFNLLIVQVDQNNDGILSEAEVIQAFGSQ